MKNTAWLFLGTLLFIAAALTAFYELEDQEGYGSSVVPPVSGTPGSPFSSTPSVILTPLSTVVPR